MSDANAPAEDQGNLRVLLGILVAVVILGALWFLVVSPLLLEDDATDTGADQPTSAQPAPGETSPAEPEEPELAQLPVETYEIFLSRDPFDPVVPETVGDGAPDADGDGQPDVVIVDGDGDGIPDGDDGTDTDGDGVPDGDDGDGVPQHDAVLIDVFIDDSGEPRALIRVGDRIFTVGEGEIFADDYTVIAIDGTCVTLAFQGSTFTLCEGGGGTGDPDAPNGNGNGTADGRCSTRDGQVVCEGRVVTLIDVFTSDGEAVAVVQVDSTLYEVRQGDDFAGNFRVISIDPPCATFLFGDDAFTLCEGQRTLK